MAPMQIMDAEHRLIKKVVNVLDVAATCIAKGHRADVALLTVAVDFRPKPEKPASIRTGTKTNRRIIRF